MDGKKLAGNVAVITGGARGIGRGYALRLAQLGSDVAIIDRNLKGFEVYEITKKQMTAPTVMDECKALGVRAMGLQVDLTNRTATESAIGDIVKEMGRIDIAVCNAGGGIVKFADEIQSSAAEAKSEKDSGVVDITTTGTPSDCSQEMLMRVINNNLMTCMYTCMAVVPYMKKQKSGRIVIISSIAGLDANRTYHPYGTAKAALIYYTRTLAQELGPYNINVNGIAPGYINSGRYIPDIKLLERIPLRRMGTVEDCAKVLEFLATDLSDYITGKTIVVDGGFVD